MQLSKELFLLKPDIVFLNHGSFGATPKPVFDAYQNWQRELESQPVEFLGRRHNGLMHTARAALADYLGTIPENVVFTQNVTIALNIVARSLKLGAGDEVLSTNHEYGAMDRTWHFLSKEQGFGYINREINTPLMTREQVVDEFWKGVTSHTRVIFLSQITSPTAIIFPVEEIIKRARAAGIITVIDGAHAPGQIPLNLESLGADFYGGNLHKWFCAPKGAGFLYARPEMQHLLKPLVVSWGYESETPSGSMFIDYHEWWGTRDIAAFLSIPAAIEFQKTHDWEKIRDYCHEIACYAREQICNLTNMPSLHSDADYWFRQMVAAPLPADTDIVLLKERLYNEYHVEVPLIEWNKNKLVRVSIQGYNTRKDADILLSALGKLLSL